MTDPVLRRIVSEYGRPVLTDPRRVEGLLRDFAPGARRETFLLVQAQRAGLVEALTARSATPEVLAVRWVRLLRDELGFTGEAARWAVAQWTDALVAAGLAEAPPGPPAEAPEIPGPRPAAEPPSRDLTEGQLLRMRGEFHRKRGDLPAALRDLNASLALSPNDSEALVSRGDVFRQLGFLPRARADLDRSIELSPSARAYAARAILQNAVGATGPAHEDMAEATAIDPERKTFQEWWRQF